MSPTPQEQLGVPIHEGLSEASEVVALALLVWVANESPIRRGVRPWVRLSLEWTRDREAYPDLPSHAVWRCAGALSPFAAANPVPWYVLGGLVRKKWLRLRAGDMLDGSHGRRFIHVQPTERALAFVALKELRSAQDST